MSDDEFEKLVSAGIDAIPERFMKKLDNVAIVIADEPSREQAQKMHLRGGTELLGLYEGIPLTERGEQYGFVLPDKITIFKNATLHHGGGDASLIHDIVRDTVWHEIAHYFGYDDAEIDEREAAHTDWTPKDGWHGRTQ
jgi:predicted Zn-dependent protease with MMP-like domain